MEVGPVIMVDGDNSVSFTQICSHLKSSVELVEGSSSTGRWAVTGYRVGGGSIKRRVLRAGFRGLVNTLFPGLSGLDSQSGLKVYGCSNFAISCLSGVGGWGGDVEVLHNAKVKLEGKVGTVEVEWRDVEGGTLMGRGWGKRAKDMAGEVTRLRIKTLLGGRGGREEEVGTSRES
ncbi:hypothetical protein TrCOL_g233 [Triparma columacea]|uniref:Uncharacterized protein n=1 Tax=Triparma columacea TaxID=722753 RepID=A0A9W7G498_9STRA|nr:hypothetical protein TrCOL_g233 [Triparma columacea]